MKTHSLILSLLAMGTTTIAHPETSLPSQHGDVHQNGVGMALVYIRAGTFQMGSPETEVNRFDNEIRHTVHLTRPFLIGKTEVTQGQWAKIMGTSARQMNAKRIAENEARKKANLPPAGKTPTQPKRTLDEGKPTREELTTQKKMKAFSAKQKAIAIEEKKNGTNYRFGDQYPMGFVNWSEAMEFCRKLTESERAANRIPTGWHYRLPTEAEWEYAARAGTTTPVFSGKQPSLRDEASMVDFSKYAWFNPYSTNRVHKVATVKPNPWGLYDMVGNVCEWCLDINAPFTSDEQTDPLVTEGPDMVRVFRGLNAHAVPVGVRIAKRKVGSPRIPYWTFYGFRVVLAEETESTMNVVNGHIHSLETPNN